MVAHDRAGVLPAEADPAHARITIGVREIDCVVDENVGVLPATRKNDADKEKQ
jgi:hypothetical protein